MTDRSGRESVERVIAARPTIYKGIEMRSRLEAGYAMWLDRQRWDWAYEPCAFGNETQQYLPDFRIDGVLDLTTGRTAPAYVEIKPDYERDINALLRRMEVIWDSEPDTHLIIQAPPRTDDQLGVVRCLWRFDTPRVDGSVQSHRTEGCATWMAACRGLPGPTLGLPLHAKTGPWSGEWWKAGADLAPVQ